MWNIQRISDLVGKERVVAYMKSQSTEEFFKGE